MAGRCANARARTRGERVISVCPERGHPRLGWQRVRKSEETTGSPLVCIGFSH